MISQPLRYYATDKELFDVLASSKKRLSDSALLDIAKRRGIFYSPKSSRHDIASKISILPHDLGSMRLLLEQSENPARAEKCTLLTLDAKFTMDEVNSALDAVREQSLPGDKLTFSKTGDRFDVAVKYTELDYAKTRLLQRRNREADIQIYIEGDKAKIRMPANEKAKEVATKLTNELERNRKAVIRVENFDVADLDPDNRTKFFTRLITSMAGYTLEDVSNVKVYSGSGVDAPDLAADDGTDEDDGEVEEASRKMLGVVENVALHGQSLLGSSEYQNLRKKGFFIASITWKSKQTNSPYHKVEFDAAFDSPREGTGFKYAVRGVYRNKDGDFTSTLRPLNSDEKEKLFPVIEGTALSVLREIRQPNEKPEVQTADPVQS